MTTKRKGAFQETPLEYIIAEVTRRQRAREDAIFYGQPITTARKGYDYAVVDDQREIVVEECGCATYLGRAIRRCGECSPIRIEFRIFEAML